MTYTFYWGKENCKCEQVTIRKIRRCVDQESKGTALPDTGFYFKFYKTELARFVALAVG
jgi:hypothetical protein